MARSSARFTFAVARRRNRYGNPSCSARAITPSLPHSASPRRSGNGRMFLIAVGDRAAEIAWFSLSGSEDVQIDWHTRSIAKLSGSKLPEHNPQIEAVCADGGGRILLLRETPPSVELIDPEALEAVASIDLVVEGHGEIARAWSDPKGSRGEGAVLLPGGHLLVAKEKKPAALIEFGPPTSQSRGL